VAVSDLRATLFGGRRSDPRVWAKVLSPGFPWLFGGHSYTGSRSRPRGQLHRRANSRGHCCWEHTTALAHMRPSAPPGHSSSAHLLECIARSRWQVRARIQEDTRIVERADLLDGGQQQTFWTWRCPVLPEDDGSAPPPASTTPPPQQQRLVTSPFPGGPVVAGFGCVPYTPPRVAYLR